MAKQADRLIETLKARFEANMHRHARLTWAAVERSLQRNAAALPTLQAMEQTGGEPDVIGRDDEGLLFCDCSAETPIGRRSLCYDREALDTRKENKPKGSAVEAAGKMGITLLTEQQYRDLQRIEALDQKTSSWIETPEQIRALGGALFCDRRYDTVFVYHNGAQSYYASRGFRGLCRV